MQIITEDPTISQQRLVDRLDKSVRTVKVRTSELQKKGLLKRKDGKKRSPWIVMFDELDGLS